MTGQPIHTLTAQQVDLLKETFKIINPERFAMRFYSNLFVLHPEVKSIFPDDLTDLSTKIISVFHLVVYSFKETSNGHFNLQPELLRPLRTLGELHSKKGVANEYYDWANQILLKSMREESPTGFTAELEAAWKLALDQLTAAMTSDHMHGIYQHRTIRDSFDYIKSLLFKKGD
jgi:hemoglobin-like flavoprotein